MFRPSEGEEGREFTALVAASARVDGSGGRRQAVAERLALLIIDDAALRLEDLTARGRDTESQVLARAVKWHSEHRVLMNGHKTVIFR